VVPLETSGAYSRELVSMKALLLMQLVPRSEWPPPQVVPRAQARERPSSGHLVPFAAPNELFELISNQTAHGYGHPWST
jgi:hypothetical protein